MNLAATVSIFGGGPGSGCNPAAGTCGRPATRQQQYVEQLVREYREKHGIVYHSDTELGGYDRQKYGTAKAFNKYWHDKTEKEIESLRKSWQPKQLDFNTWKVQEINGEWHPVGDKGWILFSPKANLTDGKEALAIGEMLLSPEQGNKWAVRLVDVSPSYGGQGVAQRLYDHAIAFAKSKGAEELISDPEGGTKDNVAGIWRKLGAEETGTSKPGSTRFRLKL